VSTSPGHVESQAMKSLLPERLVPKLWETLRHYSHQRFMADVIAGITVGLVCLPLAMAFAISSGMKPEAGIYTAIVAGFVVACLGGSRCQVSGPTGAFVVIVAGIVTQFGLSGLFMCTLMAGAMLVAMGLTGLGATVRFIPRAVTIGFTNGIAVLIASTQIKDFFGLQIDKVPSEFVERLQAIVGHFPTISMISTAVALASLGIVLWWPRITKRIPGSIIALLFTTLVVLLLPLPVETIATRFGGIPTGLPRFEVPVFDFKLVSVLLPSAITVAMLAAIESLLSAVVADNMSGDRHRPDAELVGQGVANLLVPVVGGLPITGAIARTATNIRSGAVSPVASIVHALVLLIVLLVAAPYARFIPLPTLAAILMVVAYNMGEWREIPSIWKLSAADRLVWGVTFALTVFADLTIAVQVGMALAALLYIKQVTDTTSIASITQEYVEENTSHMVAGKEVPENVNILVIQGPFLVGASVKLEDMLDRLPATAEIVILKLRHMPAIDGTGVHALEQCVEKLRNAGKELLLCGARKQPAKLIERSRLPALVGKENWLPHLDAALARARVLKPRQIEPTTMVAL
jgi:SulP family sulfate permease